MNKAFSADRRRITETGRDLPWRAPGVEALKFRVAASTVLRYGNLLR
jgi:hypothetical protein